MTVLFFAIVQWHLQSFVEQSRVSSPLYKIFWECYAFKFSFMPFLLFLCCLLLPWALSVPAFDSLFHFTWLLLICSHLRKTHFIKIVCRIRVIMLWARTRKPLTWVRYMNFSIQKLGDMSLAAFLGLASIQEKTRARSENPRHIASKAHYQVPRR